MKQAGRFTGEAFAVLPSAAHVDVAVSKNKSYLGRRYVEVFRASKLVGGPGAERAGGRGPPPAPCPHDLRARS